MSEYKTCGACRKKIHKNTSYCPFCGSETVQPLAYATAEYPQSVEETAEETVQRKERGGFWIFLISLFLPVWGLLLSLILHQRKPKLAKVALVSSIVSLVLILVMHVLNVYIEVVSQYNPKKTYGLMEYLLGDFWAVLWGQLYGLCSGICRLVLEIVNFFLAFAETLFQSVDGLIGGLFDIAKEIINLFVELFMKPLTSYCGFIFNA